MALFVTSIATISLLSGLPFGKATKNNITPLLYQNSTACIAENLRATSRYTCDEGGNVICMGGWKDPQKLCATPVCNVEGQTCINGECIRPNVCACRVGWDGPLCDECIPLAGCRHGSCSNKALECNCRPGWTGTQCDKPECKGCVNGCCHEPNKCICDFGWQGTNCTECITSRHCKNGKCISNPNECECDNGWEGLGCSKPICRVSCSQINGFCKIPGECRCRNGWTGRDCLECIPYPGCNGTCINSEPWTCSDQDTSGLGPGEWSRWSAWTACSKTCGTGVQTRARKCQDTKFMSCVGRPIDTKKCTIQNCKIDGNWSRWSRWSPCSTSCGTGNKIRHRACSNPLPRDGGRACAGQSEESNKCFNRFCPIDGRWSSWKEWAACSVSCDRGTRDRIRSCDSPAPSNGGLGCFGKIVETGVCNAGECPIDGTWSTWEQWTTCSKTCGQGEQTRSRRCSQPSFGGRPCLGGRTIQNEKIPCFIEPSCPIDGQWSNWQAWSACTHSCGKGKRFRDRTCSNPIPRFGGQNCLGDRRQIADCQSQACPVDGKWAIWRQWSVCSVTCGGGTQIRNRECSVPQFGGNNCTGLASNQRPCNEIQCFGNWGQWSPWRPCSRTCGGGLRTRTRNCDGDNCIGPAQDSGSCNNSDCPRNGVWAQWQQWSACSATCGSGSRTRNRECTFGNGPRGGPCLGNAIERDNCFSRSCSIDGNWSNWSFWSACSATCGNGIRRKTRQCNSPPPSNSGQFCSGNPIQTTNCLTKPCGIDGGFSEWTRWSDCTVECIDDRGEQVRKRFCNNPVPENGGRNCQGQLKQKRFCTGTIPKQSVNPGAICYNIGTK